MHLSGSLGLDLISPQSDDPLGNNITAPMHHHPMDDMNSPQIPTLRPGNTSRPKPRRRVLTQKEFK